MGEVSVSRALGEGFGLIRRYPGALVAWAAVYVVLGVLPQLGILSLMAPAWGEMVRNAGAPSALPGGLEAQARIAQIQPLTLLTSVASQTLLLAAAYRAVLFPEDRGLFFLRLGRRELWLGLNLLVLYIGLALAMVLAVLPLALIAGVLAALTRGGAIMVLFAVVLVPVFLCVAIWIALRFSLAPVMTFADGRFRLFESWSATRGHAGQMFLVGLVIAVIAFVVEAALGLIAFMALGGPTGLVQLANAFRRGTIEVTTMIPVAIVYALVLAALGACGYALFGGAWARIYRDLNPRLEEVF
jgi:hypothetical protein